MHRRSFGAVDGAALVVASVVGAGIFTVPSYVARTAGSPPVIVGLWLVGGLLAIAGALSYAELATRFPRGGAEYVYLREAYGEWAGFLSGWTSFIAGFSGAIAAAAVGFAVHLRDSMPWLAAIPVSRTSLGPIIVTLDGTTFAAISLIAVFTAVSLAGVSASRAATNTLALLVVLGLAVIVIAGGLGSPMLPAGVERRPGIGALSVLVPIFFTYSGWNAAAYVAGEFRDPARTIPRALIGGTLIVTGLYLALNLSLLRTLSHVGVGRTATPVNAAAEATLGASGSVWVTVLILAALASSVCALVITGPRIYTEMARDGVLPAAFGRTRGRDSPPPASALAQSLWSSLLVLTGSFEQIVTYTGFAVLLFSGAAVAALFVMRRRLGAPATFSVPWYPYIPAAFILAVMFIAVASFRYAPGPSLVGVGLILTGLPARAISGVVFRTQPLQPES
jgi:basic amino acid/polyamine antiporter, APA family